MSLECKLIEKTFTDKDGNTHPYTVLQFKLVDNSTVEIPVKTDKARLLKLSKSFNDNSNDFWKE